MSGLEGLGVRGFRVWGAGLLELWAYGSGSGLKILDSYMLRPLRSDAQKFCNPLAPRATPLSL